MSSVSVIELDILSCFQADQNKIIPTKMTAASTWNNLDSSKVNNKKNGKGKKGRNNYHNSTNISSSQVPQNQVMRTFKPMRILLQILGRFPFHPTKTTTSTTTTTGGLKLNLKKTNEPNYLNYNSTRLFYPDSIVSFHWLYFVISSAFLLLVLILASMAFTSVFLEWDFPTFMSYPEFQDSEKKLFERNLIPFVLFWSCLIHSTVGNISFILHRKRIINYLNEWEEFVDCLNLQVPSSIRNFLLASNFWYFGFLVGVVFFHAFQVLPIAVGGADLIVVLCAKPFMNNVMDRPWFWEFSVVAIIILVYSMYSSRVLLFLYAYKCRLLKEAFKMWNKQLHDLLSPLKSDMSTTDIEEINNMVDEEEATCQRLYTEHFMMTTMVKQTDKIFGGILQSYYASQILNMCFELYFLARSGKFPAEDSGTNQGDILAAIILLIQNIYIFFTMSLDAAYVNDEAQRGVEILRARGTQPNDSIHKKYLVGSLHASFHHRIVMTGGKFFPIDRPFIITVLGGVCTYFVIILQYGDNITSSS